MKIMWEYQMTFLRKVLWFSPYCLSIDFSEVMVSLVNLLCQDNIKRGKTHLFKKKYFTQAGAISCAKTVLISSQNCDHSSRSTYMAAWNS